MLGMVQTLGPVKVQIYLTIGLSICVTVSQVTVTFVSPFKHKFSSQKDFYSSDRGDIGLFITHAGWPQCTDVRKCTDF